MASTTSDAAAKVYACPVCAREFNKKANLKVHSRKHTGEKPYACSVAGCDRRFMWKSSVSFHEQNCMPSRSRQPKPEPGAQSVPKRHKVLHNGRSGTERGLAASLTTPSDSSPHTRVTNVQNPAILPVHQLPAHLEYAPRSAENARNASLNPTARAQTATLQQQPARPPFGYSQNPMGLQQQPTYTQFSGAHFALPGASAPVGLDSTGRSSPLLRNMPLSNGRQYQDVGALHTSAGLGFSGVPQHMNGNVNHKPITPTFSTESQPLPAPSTILEKGMPTAGRPPVIPMTKHMYGTKQALGGLDRAIERSVDQAANLPKSTFDSKLPPSSSSAAKPPIMHGAKTFKMPISMELDDSDDEGPDRIIGAQESFMRTGNIFAGFVPPTRCSPLPASSPIVCPGLSPMPLSPLAPFSPLPPDSPAHNAPNPVHPPLNQPQRSLNSNY